MQTFFNPTTPFFDAEGHPMVGARVSFLDLSTNASLIELTDSEGTPLPNPLFTGSDGRLRLENGNGAPAVPCIADGLSYKVVVAKKTGVEPIFMGGILQNPEELYEEPFIAFVVTTMGGSGGGADTAIVGSVADVRLADKSLGAVVCSGYYEEGDCPARVFTWVESQEPPQDNGINILRNPEDNTGYWKMSDPPAGTWDVRMAGLVHYTSFTVAARNSQLLEILLGIIREAYNSDKCGASRIYFPTGAWGLSSGFSSNSMVVCGKDAHLVFIGNNAKTVNFSGGIEAVADYIFNTPDGGRLSITCGQGAFRSKWLGTSAINSLQVADTYIIDEDALRSHSSAGAKRVVVEVPLNGTVEFSDCEIDCRGKLPTSYAHSFTNCRFTDRFFATPSSIDMRLLSLSGCILDIDDFASVSNWAYAKLKNGEGVLDFQGKYCASFTLEASSINSSYYILNGQFGTFAFRSFFSGEAANHLLLFNCRINELNGDMLWNSLEIEESTCSIGSSKCVPADGTVPVYPDHDGLTVKSAISVRGSRLQGKNGVCIGCNGNTYMPQSIEVFDSILTGSVYGMISVRAYGSYFSGLLKQWGLNGEGLFVVADCEFVDQGRAETNGKNAMVVNNSFDGAANGFTGSYLTSCTYGGNVGNCLQKRTILDANELLAAGYSQASSSYGVMLSFKDGNDVPLKLWAIGPAKIKVTIKVTVAYTAPQGLKYIDIAATAIYATEDAINFKLPKVNSYMVSAPDSQNNLYIAVPSGIDDFSGSDVKSIIVEAEVID